MNETADIGERLRAVLIGARQVTGLVDERIYPDALPQGAKLPAIRYMLVASDENHDLGGASGSANSRVQFDCYGLTRRVANAVAAAVIDLLDGLTGDLSDRAAPAVVVTVHDCTLDNKYDRVDPPAAGSDQRRYRRVIDFAVSHTTPVPSLTPQ